MRFALPLVLFMIFGGGDAFAQTCPFTNTSSAAQVPFSQNGQSLQLPGAPAELRVAQEATQLFQDTFDVGLDTTSKWTTSTGGTGIAATNVVAATVLDGGTTANSFSLLTTKLTFAPVTPGYLFTEMVNNFEFPVVTTAYRFWGVGTFPGSPTIANPVTEAVGWEIATNGKMFAVSYATGTRIVVQDLSNTTGNAKQPQDSIPHKYFLFFRGDQSYWSIDNTDNVVACFLTGASGPNVNALNFGALVVSNGGVHATTQVNAAIVGDTARNGSNATATGVLAAGIFPIVSGAGEAAHVLKASPGNLYSVYATNLTATAGFLYVVNAISAPGNGAAILPLDCVPLPANGNASINYAPGPPAPYTVGITAGVSSNASCFTNTTGTITAFIKGAVK